MPLAEAFEVVVTREAEWDDRERESLLALAIYEAGVCKCGFHKSLTHDRGNAFTFEDDVCPVCRGVERYSRIQADQDEAAVKAQHGDKTPPPAAPLPADGRLTFVRRMAPGELESTRSASRLQEVSHGRS